MKKTKLAKSILTPLVLGTFVSMLAQTRANAGDPIVNMTLGDYSTYADEVNLGQLTIPGSPTETGYIGIYNFSVQNNGGTGLPSSFWTTCLSPAGEINGGANGNYAYESYAEANPGINPPVWASGTVGGVTQYWGIQNANYLWSQVAKGSGTPTLNSDQAAGLVLAMYDALYNSTGYGVVVNGSKEPFVPTFTSSSIVTGNYTAVETAYNNDLSLLNPTAVENDLGVGYVLVPTSPNAGGPTGQEFIFMGTPSSNVTVPEAGATGVLAGLTGLIFVGRSQFRRTTK